MAGYLANVNKEYALRQAQIFFGGEVEKKEFDGSLLFTRIGHVFTHWITGRSDLHVPSMAQLWQFAYYTNRWYELNGFSVSPAFRHLAKNAAAAGVHISMIKAWVLFGSLLSPTEKTLDGSVREKTWDKRSAEFFSWAGSAIIVVRFMRDIGYVALSWEKQIRQTEAVVVLCASATRAYQIYFEIQKNPEHTLYNWVNGASAVLGVAAAVFVGISAAQAHLSDKDAYIAPLLLNKTIVGLLLSGLATSTMAYFYKEIAIRPDVTSQKTD